MTTTPDRCPSWPACQQWAHPHVHTEETETMPTTRCGAAHHGPAKPEPASIPLPAWIDACEHAANAPHTADGPAVVVVLTGDPVGRTASALRQDVANAATRNGWPVLATLCGTGTYDGSAEHADGVVIELPGRAAYGWLVGTLASIGERHGQQTIGLVGIPDAWRYGGAHVGTLVHTAGPAWNVVPVPDDDGYAHCGCDTDASPDDDCPVHLGQSVPFGVSCGPGTIPGSPWPSYRGHVNAEHAPEPDPGAPVPDEPGSPWAILAPVRGTTGTLFTRGGVR